MSKPDYFALGMAALAGAGGALAVTQLISWVSNWNSPAEPSFSATRNRRASVVPSTAKRSIRTIAFDLDGTLIKTELVWFSLLKDALKHFGSSTELHYDNWLHNHFGMFP